MPKPATLPRWTYLEKDSRGRDIYRLRVLYEGTLVRCGTYSSVAVVRTIVEKIEQQMADGTFDPNDYQSRGSAAEDNETPLLAEVIDKYMNDQLHLQPSSHDTYMTAANKIKAAVGNTLWAEVKRDQFTDLIRKAQKTAPSPEVSLDEEGDLIEPDSPRGRPISTGGGVETLLLVMRRVMRYGIGIGLPKIVPDPLFDLNTLIVQRDPFETKPLTIKDRQIYLDGLGDEPDWFQVWSLLSLYTGCRMGEAIGFQEHDFDFERRTIQIDRQVYKGLVRNPKFNSDRTIRMHSELLRVLPPYFEYLAFRRKLESRENYSKWVLPSWIIQEDLPMTPTTIATRYIDYLERRKLERRRPHDLRHTVATLLLKSGVDIRTISHILGHSDPGFTLKIYIHALPEDVELAVEMLSHLDEKVNCPVCKRPMSLDTFHNELERQARPPLAVGIPPF